MALRFVVPARQMLSALEHPATGQPPADPFAVAIIHAGVGDRDRPFEWLERAYENRELLKRAASRVEAV